MTILKTQLNATKLLILEHLKRSKNQRTVTQIAIATGRGISTCSKAITDLYADGLVDCVYDCMSFGKTRLTTITAKGLAVLAQ